MKKRALAISFGLMVALLSIATFNYRTEVSLAIPGTTTPPVSPKQPHVQFWGADVRAMGNVQTNIALDTKVEAVTKEVDVTRVCKVSVAVDMSNSVQTGGNVHKFQNFLKKLPESLSAISSKRPFQLAFSTFGTASYGYNGKSPYLGVWQNAQYDIHSWLYTGLGYTEMNAAGKQSIKTWVDGIKFKYFKEEGGQLITGDTYTYPGGKKVPLGSSDTNWEAGLGRNASGFLPAPLGHNIGGTYAYHDAADVIIMLTDGQPVYYNKSRTAGEDSNLVAQRARNAADFWRLKDKKVIAVLLPSNADRALAKKRAKEVFGEGNYRDRSYLAVNDVAAFIRDTCSQKETVTENQPVKYTYGSWAEYGIFSNGAVNSASAAGLSSTAAGRFGDLLANHTLRNTLTFANNNTTAPRYGKFGTMTMSHPVTPMTDAVHWSGGNIAGLGSGVYRAPGGTGSVSNMNITSNSDIHNKQITIISPGTITIKSDIKYTDNPIRPEEAPKVVIRARNIIIDPSVKRIDAWLIADGGYLSTCGPVSGTSWMPSGSSIHECNQHQLRINGLISADKLYLRRVYGAEKKPGMHLGTPAEIINFRPDVYIGGHARSQNTGLIRTMYIRELPPRL